MKTGDKVVCVDDNYSSANSREYWSWIALPVKGTIYVVRDTYVPPRPFASDGLMVHLIGIQGPIVKGHELGFGQWRFRKLEEMKEEARSCRKNQPTL